MTIDERIEQLAQEIQQIKESLADRERRGTEADARFAREDAREARRKAEADHEMKDLKRLVAGVTGIHGEMCEAILEDAIVDWLAYRDHQVVEPRRRTLEGETMEIDVLFKAKDREGKLVVLAGEAKSRITLEAVDHFLSKLGRFFTFFPELAGLPLVGSMGSMRLKRHVVQYGFEKGLYIFVPSGWALKLVEPPGFTPRLWVAG